MDLNTCDLEAQTCLDIGKLVLSHLNIAVVGAYQTQFGELWSQSLDDLITEVIAGCLKDGGVAKTQIQSVYIGNMLGSFGGQQHLGSLVSQLLDQPIPVTRIEAACASGGVALYTAVHAIQSGEMETALVIGAEKMTDMDAAQVAQALITAAEPDAGLAGLSFPSLYALMAQAYCDAFGAQEADLARVSVKNHHHASLNHKAHFRQKITLEHVLKSPQVARPLKMLDCSPISDGAAAVFIASHDWVVKQRSRNGVMIKGSAMASDTLSLSKRVSLTELKASRQASTHAYSQAGIEPRDIDCLEVHDCFSIAEILALEDLGLYERGTAFYPSHHQRTWLGHKQPVNTSGGLKACGHPVGATGIKQIVEATLQLRQEAGSRQVAGSRVAVTHNVGGTGGTAVVHVLTR